MIPIILNPQQTSILVIGYGEATKRRIAMLEEADSEFDHIADDDIAQSTFERTDIVFIADFDDTISAQLYEQAKQANCLVNVEDKKEFCDFHVPSIVRRGDLLLSISTNGASPRLAQRLRLKLEQLFPAHWADRLETIRQQRNQWKEAGASFHEVAKNTDKLLDEKGWLKSEDSSRDSGSEI